MAFVTTTSPDLYSTTSNLEEIPAGADPLQYADDDKMNQILVGLTALHGWASGVPVSETANGHFLALAAGSSAAVSVAAGVRIRQDAGALDYSYNTGAYARLLSKLTLASQATGDIMYASAADTWTRLAAGTNGHVLTLSGGVPTWAAAGGGGGGIAAGDNVTWTGNHAWNTGTAAFANSLGVTGTLTVTGGATISTTLGLAAGAAATPSLYATGDTNTGLYFPAADQVALTTGGTARILIDSSTLLMGLILTGPAGSASLPTYGFTGDPNTGAYSIGADQYGITAGGTLRASFNTTQQTFYTDALIQETGTSADGVLSITALTLRGRDTVGAAPTEFEIHAVYELEDSASNDQFAGSVGFGWADPTNGSEDSYFSLDTSVAGTRTTDLYVVDGAIRARGVHGFINDADTYLSNPAANTVGVVVGGTERFKFDASRLSAKFGSGSYPASYDGVSIGSSGALAFHATSSSATLYAGFALENESATQLFSLMWGTSAAGDGMTGVALAGAAQIRTTAPLQIHTSASSVFNLGTNNIARIKLGTDAEAASTTAVYLSVNGTMQRVSVGAADSESAGYRSLRIPN